MSHRLRVLAGLSAVVILVVAVAVLGSSRTTSDPAITITDQRIQVAGGPDEPGRVTIDATLFTPAATPAPAVLMAHGFGGDKDQTRAEAVELAERGFTVLTYSARGFGRSDGRIGLNAPEYEVADAAGLLTWLSTRAEVRQDAPGDPRVGVTGVSYGGSLAMMLAGSDRRVDALVPVIAYHDLAEALLPNAATPEPADGGGPGRLRYGADGVFKRAWAGALFSAGQGPARAPAPASTAPEAGEDVEAGTDATPTPPDPDERAGDDRGADPTPCGRFRPEVCAVYTELATTGRVGDQGLTLLRAHSPSAFTARVTAPTMLVQGEQDTLFGLDQSDAAARALTGAGARVKTVWYAGGHDGGTPGPRLRARIADWFDFHLAGRGADPGTDFTYDVRGSLRSGGGAQVREVNAGAYPETAPRMTVPLTGGPTTVVNPPGANPSAVSSLPGLSGALGGLGLGGLPDPPGQSAAFTSAPLAERVLLTGSPTARLRVDPSGEAVLFARLMDVGPDGRAALVGGAPAALRVAGPGEVTVGLPTAVRPVEAGHRLRLVITTTDQSFANSPTAAAHRVDLVGDLSLPSVPGVATSSTVPVLPLIGIGAVLVLGAATIMIMAYRRRHTDDFDPDLAGVPMVITDLAKAYRGGVRAVDRLSFRVEKGQVLGLLGPNGAGKTTALRMAMGLIHPTEGSVRVFGHLITPGAPVLSRVGSFVERAGFLPHLSGRVNLDLYWAATGRDPALAHMDEALAIAGLGTAVHRRVGTYSQGMRQRLAIAQAMLGLPDLLVLDEPANGLDPPQIHAMRDVLRRYAADGRTVLVSSHLLTEVEQTCTHVVVMHRGTVVASGPVDEISSGEGESTFGVDQPDKAVTVLEGIPGVSEVHIDGGAHADQTVPVHARLGGNDRSEAVTALVNAGVAVSSAGSRRRLEDAFLRLTSGSGS